MEEKEGGVEITTTTGVLAAMRLSYDIAQAMEGEEEEVEDGDDRRMTV